ncbi:MAG: hypothetical protein RLY31_1723 [Bacteroidota bacterium]
MTMLANLLNKFLRQVVPAVAAILAVAACQPNEPDVDVLVIGGGTGGVAAGIQSARMGARTLVAEPTPWLGGMLTAAGVSATDGNHAMPAGIWGEFRSRLWKHYGGPDSVATGWVSHTQFEPHVGAAILDSMAKETDGLTVRHHTAFVTATPLTQGWRVTLRQDSQLQVVTCRILIDATDLGDVAAAVGCGFDLGMDSREKTGEDMAPALANDIIQDFTWCAVLQDYGPGADRTIPRPEGYDPTLFRCCCRPEETDSPEDCAGEEPHPCRTMLDYAKLPGNKYLVNWPIHGNDYYAPLASMSETEREEAYAAAKRKTLSFVYYIQHELGFRHLGLAESEFPTDDLLPLMPYHREGRRVHGLVQLTVRDILSQLSPQGARPAWKRPATEPMAPSLHLTGIAVGDYPIDHHHKERPDAPVIDFPAVPSFNIPAGCLIPKDADHLLVADKAISVSNIVNGASRLQPVILQVGQAAGVMAALSVRYGVSPRELPVREIQTAVLSAGGYLMPYYDVPPEHPAFDAIQRVGASGFMTGTGEPWQWANRTWFYPDSLLPADELPPGIPRPEKELTRAEAAWLIDSLLRPFDVPVTFDGTPISME